MDEKEHKMLKERVIMQILRLDVEYKPEEIIEDAKKITDWIMLSGTQAVK